jgi:uncharacterized repeat protein (TIGR03943 family)
MNSLFNRWLPVLTLVLWGGAIFIYSFDGRVKEVLAEEFRTYAVVASVLLLLGALILAVSRVDASCCADAACGHGLSRSRLGRLATFAIILLPIGLAPFGSQAALNAVLAKNRTMTDDASLIAGKLKDEQAKRMAARTSQPADSVKLPGPVAPPPPLPLPSKDGPAVVETSPPGQRADPSHPAAANEQSYSEYLQKTPDGNIMAEVLDLLYAAQDQVLRRDFEGKKIQMIVQYMPDPASPTGPHRFKGVRMFMNCCAADARPIATLMEVEKLPDIPEMTWVKVIGTATFPLEKGRRISVVTVEKVEKTDPPEESMLQ